jgi:hypothetical protein
VINAYQSPEPCDDGGGCPWCGYPFLPLISRIACDVLLVVGGAMGGFFLGRWSMSWLG